MPTETGKHTKKPRIAISEHLLRRGRSRGLSENIGSTSTPKSINIDKLKTKKVVSFSPKTQIIPDLVPIREENIETNRAEDHIYPSNIENAEDGDELNEPSTSKQIENLIPHPANSESSISVEDSDSDSDNNPNLFRTAINEDPQANDSQSSEHSSFSLDKSSNLVKQIICDKPPFKSTFARRLSFGRIPENVEDWENYLHLSKLFDTSSESETGYEMATFKVSEIINAIPAYDGKESQLKLYIRSAKLYHNGVSATEKPIVLDILIFKLSGKATEAVGNVDEINTFDILIDRLNEKIPEPLSYTLAHTQLQKIIQKRGETVGDYAIRFEEALKKLTMAARQANGGNEITEAIGKTLFIQNMTDKNMRLLAASSNATTTKDVIKYVKERELILGEKPTLEDASGICGFCHRTDHVEKNCGKRKYAQKLLKISPGNTANAQSDANNSGNNKNYNNRPFNKPNGDRSFNGDRPFNNGRRFNNNRPFGNGGNGSFGNNNDGSQNYRPNDGNGGSNFRNRNNGQNSNNYGSNSNNNDNANGGRNNQNPNHGGNGNAGNRNNYKNGGQSNNQRMALNSQNVPNQSEGNIQIPLHELRAHAQFHASNSEN